MTRQPAKVLCLTEGENLEPRFFKCLAKSLGLNVKVFQVRTNIYALYKLLKDEDFQLDIKTAVARMPTSQLDKKTLEDKYLCTYLIYDLDLQHGVSGWPKRFWDGRRSREKNLSVVREMVEYFDDEYDETVGKLLINYPMMESYEDCNAFFMDEYRDLECPVMSGKFYKRRTSRRVVHHKSVGSYERADFTDLMAQNARKLTSLLTGRWDCLRYEEFQRLCDQKKIFERQCVCIRQKGRMGVLNTSLLLPLMTYRDEPVYFAGGFLPRRQPCITLVVMICVKREILYLKRFMRSLYAQSVKDWRCVFVLGSQVQEPLEEIVGLQRDDSRVSAVYASAGESTVAELLELGVRQLEEGYVLFTTLASPLCSFGLISLVGLVQTSPKSAIITFKRSRGWLRYLRLRERWPQVENLSRYDLTKGHAVRRACEQKVLSIPFHSACYSVSVLKAVPFSQWRPQEFGSCVRLLSCVDYVLGTDVELFEGRI